MNPGDGINTQNTIIEALGIETIHLSAEKVVCTMPVDGRTKQPFGMLHGGANLVLAETAASIGTYIQIDQEREAAVGMEINANHLRGVSEGKVTAVATPLHKGKSSMVWDIKITDEQGRLSCISRCTMAIKRIRS